MAKTDKDPLALMRKRYESAVAACGDKYDACIEDIEFTFVPGKQWDADMRAKRKNRPMYEFNKTRPVVKSVTNDMRQNSPALKIRAAEDGSKQLAEVMNGLIRNIEAQSRADTAYDTAGFYAAAGGYGVFEIATEYSNDDAFEQDIRIKEKRNPFSVKFDPAAKEFDKRDGRFAFEDLVYTREEFEARWPDADPVDFNPSTTPQKYGDWFSEKSVRVAKYWCKHAAKKTIYQLSDGRVLDQDDYQAMQPYLGQPGPNGEPPLELKGQREVSYDRIEVSYVSGKEVLEGPFEWAGKFIPLVPVWGESVNIEGDEIFAGIARPIKDAQRLFNWDVCVGQETMANQPRAPFLYTAAMVAGYEKAWANLATDNAPGLPYNVDPTAPNGGAPIRSQPPAFPDGFFESAQFAADLIKSVSNVVDAPIQSRAASGKAIQAVENQQDVGNFDYIDNLARAKAFGGEILVDLIPKIYDTEREIMILGTDGKESYTKLNQSVQGPDGQWQVINDLSQGKYAVTVTVGPSYATQRMETLDMLMQMAENPVMAPMVADLIAKNMDFKGSEELEKRLRKAGIAQGFIEPGEGDQPPQPPQPDPVAMADAKLKEAQAMLAQANAHKAMADAQAAGIPQQPEDNSLDVAKLQLEAQKAAQDVEIKRQELALAWFEAETARMQATMPQEAPESAQGEGRGSSAAHAAGEAAVSLANTHANQQLVTSIGPVIESMQGLLEGIAPLVQGMAQVAPTFQQTAEALAAASAEANKPKRGVIRRNEDGSHSVEVG